MKLNNIHRKKIEMKYIVIIVIISVCIIIGMISLMVRDDRNLSSIEAGIKDVGISIENILYTPFRYIGDSISRYSEMKKVYEKYKDINKLDSASSLIETENKELKESLSELKKVLDLNTLMSNYALVNATIINRDIGSWYNTITVDKGKNSGIKVGMIAIVSEGLIGKVIKITHYTSDIKLITTSDLNVKISVGITTDSGITYGLLSGYDVNSKELLIIDIVDNTPIKVGDKVVTSGLSETYPKGIIIGNISKVETDEFGISRTLKVMPSVNFNNLRYVTILKGNK
jgi:rod shape-determining protein MreC